MGRLSAWSPRSRRPQVTLYSRSGQIVSDNYQPIAKALEKVKQGCRDRWRARRARCARRLAVPAAAECAAQLPPTSTIACSTSCSWTARICAACRWSSARSDCRRVLPKDPLLIYSEHWPEHGKRLFKEAQKLGLEGIMAKRAAEPVPLRRAQQGLAQDQDRQAPGGGDRRVHGAAAIASAFRGAGAGGARKARPGAMSAMSAQGSRMPCLEELHASCGRCGRNRRLSSSASRTRR